jgi:hypothetical protein
MSSLSFPLPIGRLARTRLSHGLFALMLLTAGTAALPEPAAAGVFVSVNIAPPPLPVYVQPVIPGPGYIWVPGYWAYDDDDGDYYWVPGTWVLPPFAGALWTPGYWGWNEGVYVFHVGYWGPHVGFYGGINYGFGYTGVGYAGGYWNHDRFYYNRSVNNVTNNITNVYNKTVINNTTINNTHINRTSFNGGPGGVSAQATPQQLMAARQQRNGPVAAQRQQLNMAGQNQAMRASVNHGMPSIAATPKAGMFQGRGISAARPMAAGAPQPAHLADAPHGANPGAPANERAAPANQPGALRSASFAPHNFNTARGPQSSPNGAPRGAMNAAPANRDNGGQVMHAPPANAARMQSVEHRDPYAGSYNTGRNEPRPPMRSYAPMPASHAAPPMPAYHAAPPTQPAYRPPQNGARPMPQGQPSGHAPAQQRGHEDHEGH